MENCLVKTDNIRFFLQIMWEAKILSNQQFTTLGNDIENIGKMIGGWRKGLLIKTPAKKAGERK